MHPFPHSKPNQYVIDVLHKEHEIKTIEELVGKLEEKIIGMIRRPCEDDDWFLLFNHFDLLNTHINCLRDLYNAGYKSDRVVKYETGMIDGLGNCIVSTVNKETMIELGQPEPVTDEKLIEFARLLDATNGDDPDFVWEYWAEPKEEEELEGTPSL